MKSSFSIDWKLILPFFIIIAISLTSLGSISTTLVTSQLVSLTIGSILFYLFSIFHYKNHQQFINIYAIISTILLILPFIFGAVTRGSVRWIQIGSLTLQPSEIIKPFIIIIFANFLSKKQDISETKKTINYLLLLILPALLIFKQPDLGSTLVVIAIWLAILLASDLPMFGLGLITASGALLSPFIYKILKPYQKQRILSFLNPFSDPKGSGYHVIQSTIAVGSGGFWGKGLGSGTQSQLKFLPERHTDFIFATIAEELGTFGSLILLSAIFLLLKRLLEVAKKSPDKFSYLVVAGVFGMMFFQTVVNVGMNMGLLPITGITLPLVSAGGSSIIATMIGLGIVHNVSNNLIIEKSLEIK